MSALRAVLIVGIFCSAALADGDVVQLRNGDRLSGTIGKMDGEKLTITTPYAKDVAVDWKEVTAVESTTSHWVRLKSGDFVQARFAPGEGGVTLESGELKTPRPVPLEQIVSIGVPPGPKYNGSLGALVSGSTGNTETFVLGASGQVARETDDDRIRLGFRTENEQQDKHMTVQRTRGYGNYDYYLDERWYLTGLARFEHDHFQDLSLRTTVGGGPGYRIFKEKNLKLNVYGGLAYVNENFSQRSEEEDRDFVSLLLGDDFLWQPSEGFKIYQLLEITPSVEDTSDALFHFELGVRRTLVKNFFVDVGIADDYDTKPADDRKKNDFRYIGQLGYEF